ncbi:signal peptidase I [Salinimonas chungwhensis]|uniref:signal peptidase I n=1 Tax=Salinimonas chungwhensis TaxID=265425 RepID=UPI00036A1A41|nr:signal peptidase I [Salinimonas chungwhensis]
MRIHGKFRQFWSRNKGIITFVILLFCVRSSLADWYHIPSGSMLPTIEIGDRIFVNKAAYRLDIPFTDIHIGEQIYPERGDIVVFDSASAGQLLIKRVIGLPGDRIAMHNNTLTINGQRISYRSHNDGRATEILPGLSHRLQFDGRANRFSSFTEVTVPDGMLLVLGDNRNHSADSRVHGFVPVSELKGKAISVVASFNPDKFYLPKPDRYLVPLI